MEIIHVKALHFFRAFPVKSFIRQYMIRPTATPFAIEYVNGINTTVQNAGKRICHITEVHILNVAEHKNTHKDQSRSCCLTPGTIPTTGAKIIGAKKQKSCHQAGHSRSSHLQQYLRWILLLLLPWRFEVPTIAPAAVEMASDIRCFFHVNDFTVFRQSFPTALAAPIKVPIESNMFTKRKAYHQHCHCKDMYSTRIFSCRTCLPKVHVQDNETSAKSLNFAPNIHIKCRQFRNPQRDSRYIVASRNSKQ